jgi:hypothetical protein
MKKIFLFIFICLASGSFAQTHWLPLKMGNEYQYNREHQYYYMGKITKDTIVNGSTYYNYYDICYPLNFFIREDSVGNILTFPGQYVDTSQFYYQPEYVLFPYDAKEGDTWTIAKYKYPPGEDLCGWCTFLDSTMLYGQMKNIKGVCIIRFGPLSITFAEGIGILDWQLEEDEFILNYAKVGNQEYGRYVGVNEGKHLPGEYMLSQNYPNPLNPSTSISYKLAKSGNVILKVYDLLGNEVKTLVNEYKPAGSYTVNFDASKLSSGIYIYRIIAGSYVESRKMAVVK